MVFGFLTDSKNTKINNTTNNSSRADQQIRMENEAKLNSLKKRKTMFQKIIPLDPKRIAELRKIHSAAKVNSLVANHNAKIKARNYAEALKERKKQEEIFKQKNENMKARRANYETQAKIAANLRFKTAQRELQQAATATKEANSFLENLKRNPTDPTLFKNLNESNRMRNNVKKEFNRRKISFSGGKTSKGIGKIDGIGNPDVVQKILQATKLNLDQAKENLKGKNQNLYNIANGLFPGLRNPKINEMSRGTVRQVQIEMDSIRKTINNIEKISNKPGSRKIKLKLEDELRKLQEQMRKYNNIRNNPGNRHWFSENHGNIRSVLRQAQNFIKQHSTTTPPSSGTPPPSGDGGGGNGVNVPPRVEVPAFTGTR